MALPLPQTSKKEEVATEIELNLVSIDNNYFSGNLTYGIQTDKGLDKEGFLLTPFSIDLVNLPVLLNSKVLEGIITKETADNIISSLTAALDDGRHKLLAVILQLAGAGVVTIPPKISRWV